MPSLSERNSTASESNCCAASVSGRTTTANIQPHEVIARFRKPSEGGSPIERTMELRDTVEASAFLRIAKAAVNAVLAATGTGDTIRALAERRA